MENKIIDAFTEYGLIYNGLPLFDGKVHRVGMVNKPKEKDGWYIAHTNFIHGKEYKTCIIGNWKISNESLTTIKSWGDNDGSISQADLEALREAQEKIYKKIEVDKRREQKKVAKSETEKYNKLSKTGESEYLKRKGIKAHGVRFDNKGGIVIPSFDIDNNITTLQTIFSNGDKLFSKGGKKQGSFYPIGEINELTPICFAEGFATGASVYEALGYATVICFDSGNIEPVIQSFRKKYPHQQFIIFADNDQWKPKIGNPGKEKAIQAARIYNCYWTMPDFSDLDTTSKPTDFNDFVSLGGDIKAALKSGLNNEFITTHEPPKTVKQEDSNSDLDKIGTYPEENERPCYRVYDAFQNLQDGTKLRAGTYYHYSKESKSGDVSLINSWICDPLYIESVTHDKNGNNFGRFLKFKPTRGAMRQWCMPMAMLRGSGDDLRGELLAMGLMIEYKNKPGLPLYINSQYPKKTIEIATQTGWHKEAFILPDRCIGSDKYFFQTDNFNGNIHYQQQGTLEDWQANIARYCPNNPLLILSVCTAFMGALLKPTHQAGGGFHVYGDSSKGKSTGMAVACSVWGDENFKQSWRATSNGLEGAACMANDGILALDEISECDPREIGNVVYALANGAGKQRANRSGGARAVNKWRVAVLSNGERSIEAAMLEAGKVAKAGQSIRILNIPLFGQYGAFNELHDKKDGRELSDYLQTASNKYYGVAGVEFLKKLVSETRNLDEQFNECVKAFIDGEPITSQEARGAKRFALAAMAGELATDYGMTGWKEGDALAGVQECFKKWRLDFGKGDIEETQCLQAIKDFIERFGDSKFSPVNSLGNERIIDRAGYYTTDTNSLTVYLFNDAGMKEATKENGLKRTIEALVKHKWLIKDGRHNKKLQRIKDKSTRFYFITLPEEA